MLRVDPRAQAATPGGVTSTSRGADAWRSLLLAVAVLALLPSYQVVLHGHQWWVTTSILAVVVAGACAAARAVGLPFPTVVGAAVWVLALVYVFVPGTTVVGVPTPHSFSTLRQMMHDAHTLVVAQQSPVAADRSVVMVTSALFGLGVLALDLALVRLRSSVLAGALLIGGLVTPGLISGREPELRWFVLVAAIWVAMLRATRTSPSERFTRRSTAALVGSRVPVVGMAAVALVAAVVLPAHLPSVADITSRWGRSSPGAFARGVNPILSLGQNLRRNSTVTSLTYTTTLPSEPYLQVDTLQDFTGSTWKPSRTRRTGPYEGEVAIDPDIKTTKATTNVRIASLDSDSLPVPYPSTDVTGLQGTWTQRNQGLAFTSTTSTTVGQTYTVTSLDVQPTAAQMRAITTNISPGLRQYLSLPSDMPSIIASTAEKVTSGQTNDYDKAVALQDWFRSDGGFTYSETAPVAEGYDGTGVDVIAKFLKTKAGYCIHFASAMAVMARSLGIPSRIAVGFAPGTADRTNAAGKTVYSNTSDDLHAWPELYFQGVGWVGFEPTTGVGVATDFEQATSTSGGSDPGVFDGRTPQRDTTGGGDTSTTVTPTTDTATSTASGSVVFGLVVALLVVVLPGLVRLARRRLRLLRRGSPEPAWREVVDTARDVGGSVPRGLTPRAAAEWVVRAGADPDAVGRLRDAVERRRFGRPGATSSPVDLADVTAVRTSLLTRLPRWRRVLVALAPRSLLGGRRRPGAGQSTGGPGGVPSPNGLPPSSSRP